MWGALELPDGPHHTVISIRRAGGDPVDVVPMVYAAGWRAACVSKTARGKTVIALVPVSCFGLAEPSQIVSMPCASYAEPLSSSPRPTATGTDA